MPTDWKPPFYLDNMPSAYWFFVEFGSVHDNVRNLWYRQYLRCKLSESQNHKCCYCGDGVHLDIDTNHARYASFEHVTRRADGGSDREYNLVIACRSCNNSRDEIPAWAYSPTVQPNARIFGLRPKTESVAATSSPIASRNDPL